MTILSKVLRLLALHFQQHTLSSAEASLWCREAGEREKKKALGTMGRGKREKAFPSSHLSPRAIYFSIIVIFIGIPRGSLCGGERAA